MLRGALAQEHVAGVPGHPRVLGHEAEVERVGRVEAAESHVLQAVEEVLRRVLRELQKKTRLVIKIALKAARRSIYERFPFGKGSKWHTMERNAFI